MLTTSITDLFCIDPLAAILMALVGFIALTVGSFASRYLAGDPQRGPFLRRLAGVAASVMVMVSANHILLLVAGWMMSNLLLMRLMQHTPGWPAADASARLAGRIFTVGAVAISTALLMLYTATETTSLQAMVHSQNNSPLILPALALLIAGAMTQSALWPCHRWLLSSLNAPTPVSALMHAGLVNAGGFLLIRFAPMLLNCPTLLHVLFALGLATAMLGTLWKLMQSDVKRMLACSTMGQMGFMVAQCGLGLFPAALAHICWHGLFKAYLFLASGAAAQEKRLDPGYPPRLSSMVAALPCGAAASYLFATLTGTPWLAADSTLLLTALAAIAGTQFALPLLREKPLAMLPVALAASAILGTLYGASVAGIEQLMQPMHALAPQPLSAVYVAGLILLVGAWGGLLCIRRPVQPSNLWARLYVSALNASQPHPDTITAHRNSYRFV